VVRVLVIDDEPGLRLGVQRALTAQGLTVEAVDDGETGLERARSGAFDAIVLDVMLPKLNGFRVCSTLREDGIWTPIIMLTAKSGVFDETEGLELGADDDLTMPFSMDVLVARVHALLRRPRVLGDVPFACGDLRVDPLRHRCWRDDVAIELTAREMDVLSQLVARCGETVSKVQMLDNVWGEDFEGDPNIVEVYIRHLRRKVDLPFGRATIETVRGVGYRIVPGPPGA
jgi:two-component system, OmpR family, response regulator